MDETGFRLLRDALDAVHGALYGPRHGPFDRSLRIRPLQEPHRPYEAA
jgi:hypothetical protein